MEIRMVKCPVCGNVYNAAVFSSCPICSGDGVGQPQFSKTMPLPDTNAQQFAPTQPIPAFEQGANNERFTVTQPGGVLVGREKIAPVVGWLVAVSGPNMGSDYHLHEGYNKVGREEGDVRITYDHEISRANDCTILYHSSTESFYIEHLEGKNPVAVNDKLAIGGAMEIKPYDIVTIGATKLLFVPLCGEKFNWKNFEKAEEE